MPQRDTVAMTRCLHLSRNLRELAKILLTCLVDALRFIGLCLLPRPLLAAENLLLHKQLAMYQERPVTPKRATHAAHIALVWLGRWFDWRQVLAVVQPETCTRWHDNEGRPHMSLGPGIPQPSVSLPIPLQTHRHRLPDHLRVVARSILGGVHHEYRLEEKVA